MRAGERSKPHPIMSTPKSWTVLVYIAGDNNLDGAGVADLSEMKKVGSTDAVNIVAQFDRAAEGVATRRFHLRKGTTLDADAVASLGETNMGDPKVLESFLTWGVTKYPAAHYLVVLWNHGAGWDDTDVYRVARTVVKRPIERSSRKPNAIPVDQARAVQRRFHRALFQSTVAAGLHSRGIAFDDNARDFLDNIELKRVLASVKKKLKRKIDIVGMDACLMSMAEVIYQLREVADFTIGSTEVEPNEGWPYDKILAALVKKPAQTPAQLSVAVVKAYLASYGKNDDVTQSAFDTSELAPVTASIDALAKVLKAALAKSDLRAAIVNARAQVQTFSREDRDYIDLIDFLDLIDAGISAPAIRKATASVRTAVNGNFLVATGRRGPNVAHANGLSIYFPTRPFSASQLLTPLYATLDFTKDTVWDEFLTAYLTATRRR